MPWAASVFVALMRDREVVTPTVQMCADLVWRICRGVGQRAESTPTCEMPRDTFASPSSKRPGEYPIILAVTVQIIWSASSCGFATILL